MEKSLRPHSSSLENDLTEDCPFESVQLYGYVTIDKSTDTNRFLEYARARYRKLPAGLHDSRGGAIANIRKALAKKLQIVNIIGHGNQGMILTGSADIHTSDETKFIGKSNFKTWQKAVAAIKEPMTALRLCGCDTGAGGDGADLLCELASILNVPVEAPTGQLYLASGKDDPFLETCAKWQKATPGVRPDPIDPPNRHSPDQFTNILIIGGAEPLPVTAVAAMAFEGMGPAAMRKTWLGGAAQKAVSFAAFDKPFEPGGVPAAILTGTVELTFESKAHLPRRTFRVYNDRLLQDTTYLDIYYNASVPALMEMPN
jgi:hypothetical protein